MSAPTNPTEAATVATVECIIYRCAAQQDAYVYMLKGCAPEDLPAALRKRTGALEAVLELRLTPSRRLARVDVRQVMRSLVAQGYYLQLPPDGRVTAFLYRGD